MRVLTLGNRFGVQGAVRIERIYTMVFIELAAVVIVEVMAAIAAVTVPVEIAILALALALVLRELRFVVEAITVLVKVITGGKLCTLLGAIVVGNLRT